MRTAKVGCATLPEKAHPCKKRKDGAPRREHVRHLDSAAS